MRFFHYKLLNIWIMKNIILISLFGFGSLNAQILENNKTIEDFKWECGENIQPLKMFENYIIFFKELDSLTESYIEELNRIKIYSSKNKHKSEISYLNFKIDESLTNLINSFKSLENYLNLNNCLLKIKNILIEKEIILNKILKYFEMGYGNESHFRLLN